MTKLLSMLASLSNLTLAAAYLTTWAGAMPSNAQTSAQHLAYIILAEFTLLMLGLPLAFFLVGPLKFDVQQPKHRALFFGWIGVIAAALLATGLSLSSSAGAPWPMLAVIALLISRMRLYVHPPTTKLESNRILADSLVRVSALFFLLLPCVLIPFPSWGLPRSMEAFPDVRPAGLMVWGALYFGLLGLYGDRLDAMLSAD